MKLRTLTALGLGLFYAQIGMAADTTSNNTPNSTTTTQVTTSKQPVATQSTQTAPTAAATTTTQTTQQATSTPTTVKPTIQVTKVSYPDVPGFNTDKEKTSYSIGVDLGMNFKASNIDVDPAMIARGLQDTFSGSLKMTKEQVAATLMAFQGEIMAKKKASFEVAKVKNLQEGKDFLDANKSKPGVKTTGSGLQYKVISEGNGTSPTDTDVVTVDYSGTFLNGKVFDSSYQRGKSVTFPVSEVIHGWTEALKLMKPGATFEIYVPSNLAYGETGFGTVIGPNQTLIFKIHLVSVKKAG